MLSIAMVQWKLTKYHHTTIAGVPNGFSSYHGIDAVTNCCHLLIRRYYSSSDNSIGYERKSPVQHRPGMYFGATEFFVGHMGIQPTETNDGAEGSDIQSCAAEDL